MSKGKNNFYEQLTILVDSQVELFIEKIVSKYDLQKEEMIALWNESKGESRVESRGESRGEKFTCSHILISGKNAGLNCKMKVKYEGDVCTKHSNRETRENKKTTNEIQSIEKSKILRIHKVFKKYYHPETGFVFKSKEEKIVIGKIEGGTIVKLNERSVADCKCWGFAYEYAEETEDDEDENENEEE